MTVAIRRAGEDDLEFVVSLVGHEDVAPFLAVVGSRTPEELLAEIRDGDADPSAGGRFVIEVDGERAGTMRFGRTNERSRIAHLGGLAIHPDFRGQRLADEAALLLIRHLVDELGFHRLELRSTASTSARSRTRSGWASSAKESAGAPTAAATSGSTA